MTHGANEPLHRVRYLLICALLAIFLGGCSTIRHGGAPEPAFDAATDLAALQKRYGTEASIDSLPAPPSKADRNKFIDARIMLYNVRYVEFVRQLGVDKQRMDAATEALLLGVSIASAATGVEQAKTNLALLAATITGGKVIIDKHFYFDKTIPALVSTMNAQRKQIYGDILVGRSKSIDQYTMIAALDDLSRYDAAGTLLGAINAIEVDAAAADKKATTEVKWLSAATSDQVAERRRLGAALTPLLSKSPENLKKINQVLAEVREKPSDIADFDQAVESLSTQFREDDDPRRLPAWRKAIEGAGLAIKD